MGKVDDGLRWYLNRDEVFADFCNGVLYGGKKVISLGELAEVQKFYQEGLQGRAGKKRNRRRERDVVKLLCRKGGFLLVALENQNLENFCMPLRCMEYDVEDLQRQLRYKRRHYEAGGGLEPGAEYLSGIKRTDRFIPTVTFLLFHGEGEWRAAKSLQEMMDMSAADEAIRKLLPDYRLHIIRFEDLDEQKFETGLRELTGLMKRKNSREVSICIRHSKTGPGKSRRRGLKLGKKEGKSEGKKEAKSRGKSV